MKFNSDSAPVMVTGANGYVASWLVKMLLEQGAQVRATVRNTADDQKVGHLKKLASQHPGQLELFEADLLKPDGFDDAMQGCEIVFHTASPFVMRGLKSPEEELVQPALQGTQNVLNAVNRAQSVKRVVLTSSVVAIFGDAKEIQGQAGGKFTEAVWNKTSSVSHQPYSYSKTVAEQEAWKMARAQNRWDMVTINPGLVLGPSLSKSSVSESINTMLELMGGKLKSGVPKLSIAIVDVRDVAEAHIKAATTPSAEGRHIVVSQTASMLDIAQSIETAFPGKFKLPRKSVPKFLVWLMAPMVGLSRKFVARNVGYQPLFDNSRARQQLGVTFRPVAQTVADHARQIVEDGMLTKG